jgi:hypothetical protein
LSTRLPSLIVASPDCAELFFAGRVARCVDLAHAGSLPQLRAVLEQRSGDGTVPLTLDLVGHSTRDHRLLRLGATPIDMLDPPVARFFRGLAADAVLPRLRIVAVRLLGCETAVTESGQRTMRMLARTLGRPVYGTTKPLMKSHSGAEGLLQAFHGLLVEASDLQGAGRPKSTTSQEIPCTVP